MDGMGSGSGTALLVVVVEIVCGAAAEIGWCATAWLSLVADSFYSCVCCDSVATGGGGV